MGFVGLYLAVTNGYPFEYIPNDGTNIKSLKKSDDSKEAFYNALLLTKMYMDDNPNKIAIKEIVKKENYQDFNEPLVQNVISENISLYIDREKHESSAHSQLVCTNCHQGVDVFPHQIEYDGQFKEAMAHSCQSCHQPVYGDFEVSIHGKLGNILSCNNCHSNHGLSEKEFLIDKSEISNTCGTCHQGLVLESYERSFHGIAVQFGYEKAPTCTDCHGSHRILPKGDPASTISAANIGDTCEPCHQGMARAGQNLLDGKQHTVPEDKETGYPLWITWKIFLALILFDAVMNGTIPTFELSRHLRNLATNDKRKKETLNSHKKSETMGRDKDV